MQPTYGKQICKLQLKLPKLGEAFPDSKNPQQKIQVNKSE